MFVLYRLDFASGKSYIGQTTRKLIVRISQHRTAAHAGSQLPVHCAWRKHGEPVVSIAMECTSQDALHAAEISEIKRVGSMAPAGYNVSHGGDTAPSKNPAVAAKIAAKAKGRGHTAATCTAMAETLRQKWKDPEYQKSVSDGLKASWTDEMREATSKRAVELRDRRRASGWSMPEAAKEKLRSRVVSEESRARMSLAAKARKRISMSDETRAKLSESTKKFWSDDSAKKARGQSVSEALKLKKDELSAAAKLRWANPEYRAKVTASIRKPKETS